MRSTSRPGEAYAVYVQDDDWAARSRLDVAVRAGEPALGVDFLLGRGTVIRGTVTVGPGNRPSAKEYIRATESGGEAPQELRAPGDTYSRQVQRSAGAVTDDRGHYAIRLGPGTYDLTGPSRTKDETITVKDEPEIVRDFQMPRPEKGPLSGRVVLASDPEKGVAGAKVEIVSANFNSYPSPIYTDADGRFRAERFLDKTTLCAKTPDGALGAIVEIGQDDPEVVLPLAPTATATGLLLDERGKPAANQDLSWGRVVYTRRGGQLAVLPLFRPQGEDRRAGPVHAAVAGRRPEVPRLGPPGERATSRPPSSAPSSPARSTWARSASGPTSRARRSGPRRCPPSARMPPTPARSPRRSTPRPSTASRSRSPTTRGNMSSSTSGPPGAARASARSRSSRPSTTPSRKDDRFAILSLSVDETIDEPRAFQAKRKLPWNQAFLAGGLHGDQPGKFGVRAIPAFVLVGPDGKIVARGMRGDDIKKAVARALGEAR